MIDNSSATTDWQAKLDWQRYGPDARLPQRIELAQAQEYCRRLTRNHYENFTVASRMLPPSLRQHFCNVYAFCRWADDLADESSNPREATAHLEWWEMQLRDSYRGRAVHPVFVALMDTVESFQVPEEPFQNLLAAFRQDQRKHRYATAADVSGYCEMSANPVGRIVLYLGRCYSSENAALSDSICTGLQLANFCQDVARDWDRGRVYLPLESCRRCGYDESMFARRESNEQFRQLLAGEVQRAEGLLQAGWPLVARAPRELRIDVALFLRGGLAVLQAIRRQDYDVWSRRPVVTAWAKTRLLLRAWWDCHKM